MKARLDIMLVERGLAPSREKAQALILAGKVRVEGMDAPKAGSRVGEGAEIVVTGKPHPYVGRGGVKLEAALREFEVDPAGLVCMDIGASTGGFTHCLLLHGAKRVYAVDVGYGQLAWEVRNDPRVVVLERTNIRKLTYETVGEAMDLVVVDVSFIALAKVLREAARFLGGRADGGSPGGRVIGLVKPQFEAGREHVGKGGVVRDEAVHQAVLERVSQAGAELGWETLGQMPSPIAGKKSGNREFLVLWGQPDPSASPPAGQPGPEKQGHQTPKPPAP